MFHMLIYILITFLRMLHFSIKMLHHLGLGLFKTTQNIYLVVLLSWVLFGKFPTPTFSVQILQVFLVKLSAI